MIREERVDGMRQSLVDHREFLRSHAKQAYAILHGGGDTGGDQDLIQQADDTPESDTGLSPEAWEILLELRAPTAVIGAERRLALCRRALALLDRRSYPGLWAGMNAELGRLLPDSTEGNRADNLDRAINCYGLAFEILTKESEPDVWAEAQFNLGNNYMDRINGDRADNVECAIRCYERAIEVRTRYAHPVKWAETSINLGNGYRNRIGGERRDNLQQAVSCYQRALEVLSPEAQPMEWIGTNANLVIVNDLLAAQGKASGIVRRT